MDNWMAVYQIPEATTTQLSNSIDDTDGIDK